MEQLVTNLAQYGVVGVVAAMAIYGYLSERKDNKALRDRLESQANIHADALRVQAEKQVGAFHEQAAKYAMAVDLIRKSQEDRVTEMVGKFAAHVAELDQQHHSQEDELTDRLVTAVESYAEKNGQMTEKVAALVDSVNRRGK